MIISDHSTMPMAARVLGYAGVLPFLAPIVVVGLAGADLEAQAVRAFVSYGAVILSFLGGIRWGLVSRLQPVPAMSLVLAVLPSLWAFGLLAGFEGRAACWGLLAGFLAMGVADWRQPAQGSAKWMMSLRAQLTLAVIACHAVMILMLQA